MFILFPALAATPMLIEHSRLKNHHQPQHSHTLRLPAQTLRNDVTVDNASFTFRAESGAMPTALPQLLCKESWPQLPHDEVAELHVIPILTQHSRLKNQHFKNPPWQYESTVEKRRHP